MKTPKAFWAVCGSMLLPMGVPAHHAFSGYFLIELTVVDPATFT
jgi:hypothetical protein